MPASASGCCGSCETAAGAECVSLYMYCMDSCLQGMQLDKSIFTWVRGLEEVNFEREETTEDNYSGNEANLPDPERLFK